VDGAPLDRDERPVSFLLMQSDDEPEQWRRLFALADEAAGQGAELVPQVAARPFGMLAGLQSRVNPFAERPTVSRAGRAAASGARRAPPRSRGPPSHPRGAAAREADAGHARGAVQSRDVRAPVPLGDPPDYEPPADASIAAIAARAGVDPEAVLYDHMLDDDGRALLFFPVLNYADGSAEPIREMILHPRSVLGLGDGGAHCGILCDASMTTFTLTHWVRDRRRGARIALEAAVRALTRDPAALYGLDDRGVLRPGAKADVNVIDFDRLGLRLPEMAYDLPGGARRVVQRTTGYDATILSGRVVSRDGAPTGVRPGRLVRG
jgi:N-acyl-D-aspartate/D-glutamate deacylase